MGECDLYKGDGGRGGLSNKDKRAPSILKVVQTVGWIFALTNIKNCKFWGGGGEWFGNFSEGITSANIRYLGEIFVLAHAKKC